jgi:hypothetical protein
MPGLSLIYDIGKLDSAKAAASAVSLKHEQNYELVNIHKTANFAAFFTGYESYPCYSFANEDAVFFIEGIIYDKEDPRIASELKDIARVYQKGGDFKKLVANFVDEADGDFNILIYFKKSDELLIFCDRWGRLPSYYFCNDKMLVYSRELQFVLDFVPSIEFDKTSLVDLLAFQQTLGLATLFKDIFRLGPSGLLTLKKNKQGIAVTREFSLEVNFTPKVKGLSQRKCVEKCRDLFVKGVENRAKKLQSLGYKITADISGGYDTRAVLGAMRKLNAKVDYYTDPIRNYESKYVDALSAQLNLKPIKVEADKSIKMTMANIAFITGCNIEARTSIERYQSGLTRARLFKGKVVKFMGLEGEVLRNIYRNVIGYKNVPDMMKDAIFSSCGMPITQACELFGVDEASYYQYLINFYDTYFPEKILKNKCKHIYFDFTSHWDIAGEDRHRLHFWTATPYWNKHLFGFAMTDVPMNTISFGFNRKVIKAINPEVMKIPLYIMNTNYDSKFSVYKAFIRENLRIAVKRTLRLNKTLFKLAVKIDAWMKDTQDKSAAAKSGVYEKVHNDILASYSSLKNVSSLFNNNTITTMEDRNETRLFQLFTCLIYCGEIERRYKSKIKL